MRDTEEDPTRPGGGGGVCVNGKKIRMEIYNLKDLP